MANCNFQSQLTTVMEILAKAAVAEINRRVDDSCAILRVEITQSQRDIDVLKKKYQMMEGELRRTRGLVRRKGTERGPSPYPVKVVLNKGRNPHWRSVDAVDEIQLQSAQSGDVGQSAESEPILIDEDEAWKTESDPLEKLRISRVESHASKALSSRPRRCDGPLQSADPAGHYHSAAGPEELDAPLPPTEHLEVFSEQHRPGVDNGALQRIVKDEREGEEESVEVETHMIGSDQYVMDDADRHLWSSNPETEPAESDFSFATDQYQQSLSMFPSHSGMLSGPSMTEDAGPSLHFKGKRHAKAARPALVKRHNRSSGDGPSHMSEEGESSDGVNLIDENGMIVQQQYRTSQAAAAEGTSSGSSLATTSSAFSGYSRSSSFNMARRIRTPWRSGVGERRFSCTFCGKSFMRFSQLKEHLRSHTGEKPFTCAQCGRSFTKQCNLIRHAVVHSGEKPFECAQCGKCFTQRSSLKSHQRTHVEQSGVSSLHTRPMLPAYTDDPHTGLLMSQSRCFK